MGIPTQSRTTASPERLGARPSQLRTPQQLPFSSLLIACAALCVLLVMSVPSQQRVAAKSFCECYQPCHDGCNHSVPWWICNVDCVDKCHDVGYREESLAACYWVCSTDSACGPSVVPTYAEGVVDCKVECFKRWGHV